MSHAYTPYKTRLASGGTNWAGVDVRAMLVMSNTTADTDQDVLNPADIGTLDEYNGAGYARVALTGEAVNEDAANNRAEMDANDITFGATVSAGTRQAVGMVIYQHVTTDTDHLLMLYIDSGGFPFNGSGGPVNVTWNAEGIAQIT